MSRHLRFVPEGGAALVEVTCRTIQGRLLLRPSQQVNDILHDRGIRPGRMLITRPALATIALTCIATVAIVEA